MRISIIALVLAVSSSAFAHAGYVTTATGEVAVGAHGECVHSGQWAPENIFPGCDGMPLTPPPAPPPPPPPPPPVVVAPMDTDKDKDGVVDDADKCPATPAGVAVDGTGCPLDADKDGVADYLDKCPGTPESVVVDDAGCTKKLDKEVTIGLDVHFVTGKADIEGDASGEIAKVATFMKKYPDTKVTIEGYTDNVGAAAANKKLSQKRADAVKAALVAGGVDAPRLNSLGFGQEGSVADNKTDEGRAQNRRVIAHAKAEVQVAEKKKDLKKKEEKAVAKPEVKAEPKPAVEKPEAPKPAVKKPELKKELNMGMQMEMKK
ncbi:MAG: OmpA family protein [Polyangiaceae bacterium]